MASPTPSGTPTPPPSPSTARPLVSTQGMEQTKPSASQKAKKRYSACPTPPQPNSLCLKPTVFSSSGATTLTIPGLAVWLWSCTQPLTSGHHGFVITDCVLRVLLPSPAYWLFAVVIFGDGHVPQLTLVRYWILTLNSGGWIIGYPLFLKTSVVNYYLVRVTASGRTGYTGRTV